MVYHKNKAIYAVFAFTLSMALLLSSCQGVEEPAPSASVTPESILEEIIWFGPYPQAGDAEVYRVYVCQEGMMQLTFRGDKGVEFSTFADTNAQLVNPLSLHDVHQFSGGAAVCGGNDFYIQTDASFKDRMGETLFRRYFYNATPFSDGLALCITETDHHMGYIILNCKGEVVDIPFSSEEATPTLCYRAPGNGLRPHVVGFSGISEGMMAAVTVQDDSALYGFYTTSGELAVPCVYDAVNAFHSGLARVNKDDAFGYIDKTGKVVIPIEYGSRSKECTEDRVWVEKDGLFGCFDSQGNLVIPFQYVSCLPFTNGLAIVMREDTKCGAVDRDGNIVIPFNYDNLVSYYEGLCPAKKDGLWGVIDVEENVIVPFCFNAIGEFHEGVADVRKDTKRGILVNPQAKERSDWAAAELEKAEAAGLVTLRTERWMTHDMTRLQCAELLVNLVEQTTGEWIDATGVLPFTDTLDRSAREAYAAGLVKGTGDGSTFSSDGILTREQLATILCRAIRQMEESEGITVLTAGDLDGYEDAGEVSSWAAEAMGALTASGLLQGTSPTTLSPQDPVTVEQAIVLVYRVYQSFL